MTKEGLDSDKVNYLIWRYLVESGYGETAVRLQKEWNNEDPQQLPFAPHVTNHALVNLCNKGLLYNAIEREGERPAQETAASVAGVFGPVLPPSPAADQDVEKIRKRQIESEPQQESNGPPVKKPKLANGYENGLEPAPMEMDDEQNGDEHAYPSPEQAPSPVVATVGPEQGTQVDKVSELTTETTFLDLSDDAASNSNVLLLQCAFNPRDAAVLAAAGTDALARMWTFTASTSELRSDPDSDHTKPGFAPHHNLLDAGTPSTTTASGISWAPDGSAIAVSSEPPNEDVAAKVEFWRTDGSKYATYSTFEPSIYTLRWNPSSSACLAISPENKGQGTLLTVLVPTSESSLRHSLSTQPPLDQVLDTTWTSNDEFIVGGGDFLQTFHCAESSIVPTRKFETREGHAIAKITYDSRSGLLATASDSGMIDIWDHSGQSRSYNAHQGIITDLAWQPIQSSATLGEDAERLLASSGEDGAISIWNARSPDAKPKSSMTMSSGVVALSFTPDGAFLAAGTNDQILIWKVDDVHVPRAIWLRGDQPGWRTPQSHDSSTSEEDQFSLSWDANGQKLAYAFSNRLAVINFRP